MKDLVDYYQAADCLAQASLEEGLGLSPLEALATGTPAVCTAVGGLTQLEGHCRLVAKRDAKAMCDEFLWIDAHREEARAEALRSREWVVREWSRKRAFAELHASLASVTKRRGGKRAGAPQPVTSGQAGASANSRSADLLDR
jgi:glycosyltransferase involved in cell wall biosynthesis